jgi:hypothetical protein
VIRAAGLDKLHEDKDLAILLDWVYYQDVLARFSLRHWYRRHGVSALNMITIACTPIEASTDATDWIDQVRIKLLLAAGRSANVRYV